MAEYVKIWTTIQDEEWFSRLSLHERGFFLQAINFCKRSGDVGDFSVRSTLHLSQNMGCDGKTAGKILRKLRDFSLLTFQEGGDGVLRICIPKYKYWQGLRKYSDHLESKEKSGTNPHLTNSTDITDSTGRARAAKTPKLPPVKRDTKPTINVRPYSDVFYESYETRFSRKPVTFGHAEIQALQKIIKAGIDLQTWRSCCEAFVNSDKQWYIDKGFGLIWLCKDIQAFLLQISGNGSRPKVSRYTQNNRDALTRWLAEKENEPSRS